MQQELWFKRILILVLLLTPLFSIMEIVGIFLGGIETQSVALTSPFIKSIKDLVLVLLLLLGLISIVLSNTITKWSALISFGLIGLVLPSVLLSIDASFFFILSGFRWLLPVFFPLLCYRLVSYNLIKILTTASIYLLFFHLLLQLLQLFLSSGWYGIGESGLSLRNPGMFFIPNTAGFFSISVFLLVLISRNYTAEQKIIIGALVAASVYLTASGTATILYIMISTIYVTPKRVQVLLAPFMCVTLALGFFFIEEITSRGDDYVSISGGQRIQIFIDALSTTGFFSSLFGRGTSTAFLLGLQGISTDSWFAAILINLGTVGFLFLIVLLMIMLVASVFRRDPHSLSLWIVLIAYGSTTSLTEAFPMYLIIGSLIVYLLRWRRRECENPQGLSSPISQVKLPAASVIR